MGDSRVPPRTAGATAAESALKDLLGTFQAEAEATRSAIELHENNRRKQLRWGLAIMACMAVIMGMVLGILLQNRQKSEQSREILRRNGVLSQQIADCTTAGGKCYEEGAKRSGQAVGQLIAAIEEIAVCDKVSGSGVEVRACVDRALAKLGASTSPAPRASTGVGTPSPTP